MGAMPGGRECIAPMGRSYDARRLRISASKAQVTGSSASPSPRTAGNRSPAIRLPSSTPHWSKALMHHSTDCA